MEEAHKVHSQSPLYSDEKAQSPRKISSFRRHRYRTLGAVATTIAILGITLGVGLGVGLTNSGDAPSSTSTVTSDKRSSPPIATASQGLSCQAGSLSLLGGLNVVANTTPLWQPLPGTPWQIVLNSPIDASRSLTPALSVYDIDMYGNSALTIQQMHLQGIKVICYFSAGSWEIYRPDAGMFPPQDIGNDLHGWPGERWLNTESKAVRDIMANRIKLAAEKGCDAVDPDNVDGFGTDTGFPLTSGTALNYLSFLSLTAASYNMAIGLKNAGEIAANATCMVEFAIIESCIANGECDIYQNFIAAGKPVFQIEYPFGAPTRVSKQDLAKSCKIKGNEGYSEVIKGKELGGWVEYCDGTIFNTATYG
ncbi:glycoside hydrolase family 114 protein [Aureobasidium subglaciale EXF-2481]|uniref:alpha-galactosidase n=1 Tax=Aureobasidium subglaciale (strain EXF-2481) TaxID=1043005 RepID=A0A074YFI6_AURSE|nr:glycoside hydrolase family 114 protein [Aureobasidium subglaciale EXF-2481]KAI5203204.1 endo alpha-1,4 polygalactosaminidase [Aureobasidium subglaciale]KAI5220376.1 endo alpha-1,4 polygalactosaminidase [Aureobasidium subglaciale]KAI5222943.1 endo alpha-1,4 polygalactosaminidase [Aureobasidium subglaciale]KAI5260108.1 endo alpha-1,4 polygalactosaminidase [Aureobasidium subglaciale]KEQ96510.1 glycoside hydrolase family 114 protein [Aureobasidium subglaciale EXF-2481]